MRVTHNKVVSTEDSGDGKVSSNAWNDAHDFTGTPNYLVGFDGSGNAIDVNPATLTAGVSDGDKGDIVVSGSGSTWTIDPSVITTAGRSLVDDASVTDMRTTLDVPSNEDMAAAIASATRGNNSGLLSGFVSGGNAIWVSGLQFRVTAASYYIAGVLYTSAEQTITLNAADGSNPRIDVLALDTTGTLVKITGTAAAAPSEPDIDPGTQIEVTFVTVPAGATAPAGTTNENIYLEDAEWTTAVTGSHIVKNSTSNPRTGTKDIEATNAVTGDSILLNKGSTLDPSSYSNLVLFIRNKTSSWGKTVLRFNFTNSSSARVGNIVSVANGTFGLSTTNTSTYQAISIPLTNFAIPAGTLIQKLNIAVSGSTAIGWYIDDMVLQANGTGGSGSSGITQAQADARYQPLDSDLTALAGLAGVQGDIIYRDSSQWQRLAAGTSGTFLKTQGAGANPTWAAPNLGISGNLYPTTAPVDGNFAWVNQGTASVTVNGNGGIFLRAPASTGPNLRIRKYAAPATPYTVTGAMFFNLVNVNFQNCGIALRNSSSGKVITFSVDRESTFSGFTVQQYTSATVLNATPKTVSAGQVAGLIYLQVTDDGTNRVYRYSYDGYNFVQLYTELRTAFSTTDEIGFYANDQTNTYDSAVTLLSWTVV